MIPLREDGLNEALAELGVPWRVRVAPEVGSTSDEMRAEASAGAPGGQVMFAECQTAGRGRRDNRWITPRGKDLMFSLLLRPEVPMALWPRFTTLAALALCKAVEQELPLQPRIKWPNDLYVNDKKVAGLLAEAVVTSQGAALVLGIGLNVNSRDFPPELAGQATSLLRELESQVMPELDRQPLAVCILAELHTEFQRLESGAFAEAVAEVRARSWLLGRQIRATVEGRELYGRAMDLNAEGHLVLALPDGSMTTLASADGVRQVV